jgi:hypothetical protein
MFMTFVTIFIIIVIIIIIIFIIIIYKLMSFKLTCFGRVMILGTYYIACELLPSSSLIFCSVVNNIIMLGLYIYIFMFKFRIRNEALVLVHWDCVSSSYKPIHDSSSISEARY